MRLHYLQHVLFEDLARIEDWAEDRGHEISRTLLFDGQELPGIDEFDWLVIMGGPMNIYEEDKYPWLAREKRFIRGRHCQQQDCPWHLSGRTAYSRRSGRQGPKELVQGDWLASC